MSRPVPNSSAEHGPSFDPSVPGASPTAAFLQALTTLGVACEPAEMTSLGRYLSFLRQANERFNLTAVTDEPAMWLRHIADSLSLLPVIASVQAGVEVEGESDVSKLEPRPADAPWTLIDVGSGGGLPGIPLAICLPDIQVTLLEATGKKVRFLEEVVAALELRNVRVLSGRAEEAGRDRVAHREHYDFVTSRAVGPLATLVELTVPFLRIGGMVLAIKGERAGDEIIEAKQALYALHAHALEPMRTETGTIVPIRKMRTTPKIYPRRPGEPKRVPLGVKRADRE